MRTRLVLSLSFLACASVGAQQRDFSPVADTVFSRWNSTHTPGCALGVSRDGKVLLTRGYGMADLETGAPITVRTIFESGSVAKQFTATAVVLLAMDGKLDLADPVRKYLPEFPQYDRPITVRHLLTHTSGLREWSNLVATAGWPRGSRSHTQADLLDVVYRQKALNYPVGDYYSYTNSGYAVAMSLVERVSGKSFQEFTQERIFRPLGMTHTQWRDDFTRLVPDRAQAYSLRGGAWHLDMPFETVVGPGGLLTTVGDWLIWNDALAKGGIRPGHTDSLTRRMKVTSGREIRYALGVSVTEYRGVKEISHSGSTAGYSTFLARYPDRGNLSIAVLCNSAQGSATTYTHQLADRLITDFPAAERLDTTRVESPAVARFFGIYRSDRMRNLIVVDTAAVARLRALPNGWFLRNNQRLRFETGPNGRPSGLITVDAEADTIRYVYAAEKRWVPTRQDLAAFEGQYRSDEVGVTYDVRVAGDSLTLSARPGVVVALQPTYPDTFDGDNGAVWFTRDRGRVIAMHFSESRMWDLVLTRISPPRTASR
ncbi:MAG TPA: serine hydrolase domain-containing protein [Gemmatimonadaceae bacterium]|nr:serine hydrolase domain-containing protein [Gemmatimonadaceae bacterium]